MTGQPRLRVAVVGCGVFGNRHIDAILAKLGDRLQIVATVDPDPAAAAAAAEKCGARWATNLTAVLEQVDAVTVATPHHLHAPLARDALAAGCHVFMEKPLAMNEEEGLDLVRLADLHAKVLMVGYPLRYHPLVAGLKSEIDGGRWGEPFHVSLSTEQFLPLPEGHWRASTASRGGGGLFSHGCHYIDLLLWILGEPIRGVTMGTTTGTPWQVEGDTTGHTMIEFAGGRIGHHFATEVAHQHGGSTRFVVHLTEGMLLADHRAGRLEGRRRGGDPEREVILQTTPRTKFLERELGHFADCVRDGSRPLTDAAASLQSLRVIWRLYQAEAEGRYADLSGLGLPADPTCSVAEVGR